MYLDGKALDNTLLKFEPNYRRFSIYINVPERAGSYIIKVFGKLLKNGKIVSKTFSVTVYDPCVTSTLTPSNISDVNYQVGQGTFSLTFPPWTDSLGYCGPPKFSVKLSPATQKWPFTLNFNTRKLLISLNNGYDNETTYTITLSGIIRGGVRAETSFTLSIIPKVPPPFIEPSFNISGLKKNKTNNVIKIEPNLDAKITSINTRGEVTIMFSKEVNFTSNLTLFRAKEAFSLVIEFRTA
jgi:hypothetical protein